MLSQPAAVAWGPNRLDVFALGTDYAVWHDSWSGTSDSWSGWQSLGGGPFASEMPTVVSSAPETIDLFALSKDHSVWHSSLNSRGQWSEWESLNMTSILTVGACSWPTCHLDVFAIGSDSAAWHEGWNGSSWSGSNSLGGIFESSINGLCFSTNSIDLFGLGHDSAVSSAAVAAPTGTFGIIALIVPATSAPTDLIPAPIVGYSPTATAALPILGKLSVGAVGGITGGVLGSALLICLVLILYLVRRRKKAGVIPGAVNTATSHNVQAVAEDGTETVPEESHDVGGRLNYPDTMM